MQKNSTHTLGWLTDGKTGLRLSSHLLVVVRGRTSTCTAIWCCPTTHVYQASSLSRSFFRVTLKVLILSSLMATEESSKPPRPSVCRQELQSPLRHHFFTLALSTGSHRGVKPERWLSVTAPLRLPVTNSPYLSFPASHMANRGKKTKPVFHTVRASHCDAAPLLANHMVALH